jgi:hypothetical protein
MLFTTHFWGSTAVLLCALLFQNCQPNSLSATAEEELAESTSASSMHQRASSESLAVGVLDFFKEDHATVPPARSLGFSESFPFASVSNPLEDSKPSTKRQSTDLDDEHSCKKVRDGDSRNHRCVCRDILDILLSIAGSEPNKVAKFLKVLLFASQDNDHRQQALEVLGNLSKASPNTFSGYLPSLRAAANAGDKDFRLLALKTLGEVEWKYYFGEVGPAPDLPRDMVTILDASCPFWPEKKVKDTHLLVLIPAQVDERPFTLNLLRELIKAPKRGGSKTKYKYYGSDIKTQFGNNAPASSYWVLLTRDVLPESRYKTYAAQEALVSAHASRTRLSYELPKALEAATAILMHHVCNGERLCGDDPWTYTRCQELIRLGSSNFLAVVGGFDSSGLNVNYHYYDAYAYDIGVAGCRKF